MIFLKCKIRFICRIQLQKKKSGVKKCLEILPLRGGVGVGRLMANAILNFHFDYLNTSLIAVVNPQWSSDLPTLPESVLQINLTTPYRSTIAITSLARFLVKSLGVDVPEGEFGSDVEGKKPIVFDIGKDEVKLREALQRSRDLIGDDATLLYNLLPSSMKEIILSTWKEKGGPWDCSDALNFFGWEADTVVAVTAGGGQILEMITRAKTQLIIILVEPDDDAFKDGYKNYQKHFQDAAAKGLDDLVLI